MEPLKENPTADEVVESLIKSTEQIARANLLGVTSMENLAEKFGFENANSPESEELKTFFKRQIDLFDLYSGGQCDRYNLLLALTKLKDALTPYSPIKAKGRE